MNQFTKSTYQYFLEKNVLKWHLDPIRLLSYLVQNRFKTGFKHPPNVLESHLYCRVNLVSMIFLIAGPALTERVLATDRCERALQKVTPNMNELVLANKEDEPVSKKQHQSLSNTSSPILDELVELILRVRSQEPSSSSWNKINLQSLIAEKRVEIEKKLGKKAALRLFNEARARVMKRILVSESGVRRASSRSNSEKVENTRSVKILKPKLIQDLIGHSNVVFSPDGLRVLTGSDDRTAKLWDVRTGELLFTLRGHMLDVRAAVFSPDGSKLLTASGDSTARLWDTGTGQLLQQFLGHRSIIRTALFSNDGSRVFTGSDDRTAKIWNARTGELLETFDGHTSWITSIAL